MNKSELIDALADRADISKTAAKVALDSLIDVITEELKKGNEVALVGFGSFATKLRPERAGRNPATGAPMTVAAARVPGFKAGKSLKDAVNA